MISYTILSSNGKISVYVLTLADYAKLVDGENFLYYTSYSHLSVQQAFLDPTAFEYVVHFALFLSDLTALMRRL